MIEKQHAKKSTLQKLLQVLPGRSSAPAAEDVPPPDQEAIESWLVDHISNALEVDPDEIDIRAAIGDFGLNSRTAVRLSGEMERWLGRRLSPTLVWDFPTIDKMAAHLANGTEGDAMGWQDEPPETDATTAEYRHER